MRCTAEELHVRVAQGQLGQGQADAFEATTEVLSAVAGDQHHALVVAQHIERGIGGGTPVVLVQLVAHPQQGVDHRAAGDLDVLGRHAFADQVGVGVAGGGEVQVGEYAGQAPVGLLGPGLLQVAGAQAGLDVADGNVAVEGGQRGDEAGGGVAVDQDDIGLDLFIGLVELVQQVAGQAVEGLVLGHHLQVLVDLEAKGGENLFEHFAVLAGGADLQVDSGQSRRTRANGAILIASGRVPKTIITV